MAIINPLANTAIQVPTMLRQQPGTFPVQLRPLVGAVGTLGWVGTLDFSGGVPPLTVNPPNLADTGNPDTNGTNLQNALTAATIGSTIVVQSGVEYRKAGAYTFPAQGASWDMRRTTLTSTRSPQLPAGTRVTPGDVAKLATLTTSAKSATLDLSGSRGWTLSGLEVSYTNAAQTGTSTSLQLVQFSSTSADLTLDRCWVHPRESVTAPTSFFRAVDDGITGIVNGTVNIALTNSYLDGFTGWGYDNKMNHMGVLYTNGGSHLRVKNNYLQGYRTWYLERNATTDDTIIQGNTFDSPIAWESYFNPSGTIDGVTPATTLQEDHRHLILYAGTNVLIVGNSFVGATRGSWGIFFDQAVPGLEFGFVRYLSNFLDSNNGKTHLCMLVLAPHSLYSAHDLAFVNNLVRQTGSFLSGYDTGWSTETQGPAAGAISPTKSLTATHGVNFLHNTVRRTFNYITYPHTVPHSFYDFRYNIGNFGNYGLNTASTATDYPGLVFGPKNNWIDSSSFGYGSYSAYTPASDYFANDAAVGFFNIGAADGGGAITGYSLAAGASGYQSADLGLPGNPALDVGCDIPTLQAALNRTSTDWDYPELPRASVDTTYAAPGSTVTVTAGSASDLQSKIDTSPLGTTIIIPLGTYSGNFLLRKKTSGSGWIYLRSANYSSLPAPGTRVGPSDAANMPTIVTPNNNPAIACEDGAHHYRLVGLQVTSTSPTYPAEQLINTDSLSRSFSAGVSQLPTDITVDRCYFFLSTPFPGVKHAVGLHCQRGAVIESYFNGIGAAQDLGGGNFDRPDSQAVHLNYGPGPYKIINNFLEAAGENLMAGGDDPYITQMLPCDIEIRNNYFFKRLAWIDGGGVYAVKNMLELKVCQRVWIEGNTFENNWGSNRGAQQEYAISLTVRNQSGFATWSRTQDITFRRNTFINNLGGTFNLTGIDDGQRRRRRRQPGTDLELNEWEVIDPLGPRAPSQFPTQVTNRVLIQHNDIRGSGFASGQAMLQILAGIINDPTSAPQHVIFDHNTALAGRFLLAVSYAPVPGLVFTNNVVDYGANGIGDNAGTSTMRAMMNTYFPDAMFRNNLIVQPASTWSSDPMIPRNLRVADQASVGFVNLAGGNYQLSTSSPGYRAGWEGLTLGFEP